MTAHEAEACFMQSESYWYRTLQIDQYVKNSISDTIIMTILKVVAKCLHYVTTFSVRQVFMFTLFPKQPITPQPTHETLELLTCGRSSLRTQTEINIPTICLLMMHLKLALNLVSSAFVSLLIRAFLIKEFHLMEILLFSGPSTFPTRRGTTSWNLHIIYYKPSLQKNVVTIYLHI